MAKANRSKVAPAKGLTDEQIKDLGRAQDRASEASLVFGAIYSATCGDSPEDSAYAVKYAALYGLQCAEDAESILKKLNPQAEEASHG